METIKIHDKWFRTSYTETEILKHIKEVADRINNDMKGKNPLFLAVLNGSFMFAADLMKMINKRKFNHEAIAHYVGKYGFVPLWVLSKVMTFGKINSFYAIMLNAEKIKVAESFNLSPKNFKSLVDYLAKFRNKCAHGERIYSSSRDSFRPRPIPRLPIHDVLNIPCNAKGYKYGINDMLALLIAMKPFMQEARFSHLVDRINYALNTKLKRRLNSHAFEYVTHTMGLVDSWTNIKVF